MSSVVGLFFFPRCDGYRGWSYHPVSLLFVLYNVSRGMKNKYQRRIGADRTVLSMISDGEHRFIRSGKVIYKIELTSGGRSGGDLR